MFRLSSSDSVPVSTLPARTGAVVVSEAAEARIADRLRAAGVPLVPFNIDVADYCRYVEAADYTSRYPDYYSGNIREKSLEHYLAALWLSPGPGDRYVDIASEHSPVPEIYGRLFGCETFRQDLSFPPGLNGDTIGSDAADMPVPAGFASRMALHCSFEHFEGDTDIRFIAEARRVLRPGGRLCIVPFYLAEEYCIQSDPVLAASESIPFEPDAIPHLAEGWGNRFGRFYDVEHAIGRVLRPDIGLSVTVFHITNRSDVDRSCYARFGLLLAKPQ